MGILKGKTAIITGASSGVGYGCALRFAEEGANVVACARRMENLEKLCAEASGLEGKIISQRCDISVEADLDAAVQKAVDTFGTVHILANIAQGGLGMSSPLSETTVDECMTYYMTGPIASMKLMQKCFPYMKAQHYGRIINCSSEAASKALNGFTAYGMCKAAVEALTRNAAQEWAQYGITTNVFMPFIKTENTEKSERGRKMAERVAAFNQTRRFGTAYEDCSPMVAFLVSEGAGYINGEAINISGGGTVPLG